MKSNTEIIQDTIEQVVNQKDIDAWDQYFSPAYIAHSAPFIGMGFMRKTSKKVHVITAIFPGSPAEGVLEVGDELLWVEDENRRWETYKEIEQGLLGRTYTLGIRRDDQTLAIELSRDLFQGFDTPNDQAKAEMQEFMTAQYPDLSAAILLILADGDMVVSLLQYRGTHAKYNREVVWREAWFTRLSNGLIVESWPIIDESAFYRHLGYRIVPPRK